ncbi:unnamed protein product [Paramecium primaurelia]|uniref:Ubiquitin-like domain-containing protein n=1 Tax=Paramecium primaurelia TaxID=5886 RepID=A0A8S1PJN3_PARPR|nr:unnamed protein product [Paramecium primaurelia]
MSLQGEDKNDEKKVQIIVEYVELSKNYTIQCPINISVYNLVYIISEVINKPSNMIFLRYHNKTLDLDTILQDFCQENQIIVLSLNVISDAGFRLW